MTTEECLETAIVALMKIADPTIGVDRKDPVALKRAIAIASNPENQRKLAWGALGLISQERAITMPEPPAEFKPKFSLVK